MNPSSILVVDDHEPTRRILALWLETRGYRVVCATSGNAASEILRQSTVDMVITDVLMPDGDGIELIAKIKKTQPKLRVLAISGGGPHSSSASCLSRAHTMGAHALLLKPFHQDQLASAMQYVLSAKAAATAGVERDAAELRVFPGFGTSE